jgi:hypothetical protein
MNKFIVFMIMMGLALASCTNTYQNIGFVKNSISSGSKQLVKPLHMCKLNATEIFNRFKDNFRKNSTSHMILKKTF